MNKLSKLIVIAGAVSLVSCANQEPSPREFMEDAIEKHLYSMLEDKTNGYSKADVTIVMDSVEVMDTITRKKELGYELVALQKKAVKLADEGKEIKKKYQDKKDLASMYTDASGQSEDSFSSTMQHDLDALNKTYKEKSAEATELLQKMNDVENEMKTADSIVILYYHVIGHYKAEDNKSKREKKAHVPFHISPEYRVLRDAREILGNK